MLKMVQVKVMYMTSPIRGLEMSSLAVDSMKPNKYKRFEKLHVSNRQENFSK